MTTIKINTTTADEQARVGALEEAFILERSGITFSGNSAMLQKQLFIMEHKHNEQIKELKAEIKDIRKMFRLWGELK